MGSIFQIIQIVGISILIFGSPIFVLFKLVQIYKRVKDRDSPLSYEESVNFWGTYIIATILALLMFCVVIFTLISLPNGTSAIPVALAILLGTPVVLLLLGHLNKIQNQASD